MPDLRGRTPIHRGDNHSLGQKGGFETVTLTDAQIAAHTHSFKASSTVGIDRSASGQILAAAETYRDPEVGTTIVLRSGSITSAGGSQAHNNMQPYTALNFAIALQGLFPSRN